MRLCLAVVQIHQDLDLVFAQAPCLAISSLKGNARAVRADLDRCPPRSESDTSTLCTSTSAPGIADGAQHAAPVGVRAEHRGLEQAGTDHGSWPPCARSACRCARRSPRHSSSLVAPSPSRGDHARRASDVTCVAAPRAKGRRNPRPSRQISVLPARPLARMATMSLVEVSPSTLTMLKLSCTSLRAAPRAASRARWPQSVVRKHQHGRHVGMDHAASPWRCRPWCTVLPSTSNSTANCLDAAYPWS